MLIPSKVFKIGKISKNQAVPSIRFEREASGQAIAIVTNGHSLLTVTWQEDKPEEYPQLPGETAKAVEHKADFSVSLPADICVDATKLPPKKSTIPILGNVLLDESGPTSAGTFRLMATDIESVRRLEPRPAVEDYPQWRKAMPDTGDYIRVELNAAKLAELALLVSGTVNGTGKGHNRIELLIPMPKENEKRTPRNAPIVVKASDSDTTATGILMPLGPR